jgi:hypothetical protein
MHFAPAPVPRPSVQRKVSWIFILESHAVTVARRIVVPLAAPEGFGLFSLL